MTGSVIGHWSLVIGHLVTGSLVIWSLVTGAHLLIIVFIPIRSAVLSSQPESE